MKKYALASLISNLLLLVMVAISLFSINSEVVAIQNAPPAEGLDMRGLSVGILTIFAIFALIYAGVVVLNLIIKGLHFATEKWGFAIPCILFDLVLLVVNAALLVSSVNDGEMASIALSVLVTLASLFSIIMNGRSIAARND